MLIQTEQETLQVVTTTVARHEEEVHEEESAATAHDSDLPLTQAQMRDLAERLANRNQLIREPAERELFSMDSVALTSFLACERQMRRRKMKQTGIAFSVAFAFVCLLQALFKGSNPIIYFGAFSGLIGTAAAFTNAYRTGVVALSRFENSESVGELIPALDIRDSEVQQKVRGALVKLLPQLRASDRKLMTETNRRTIIRFLRGRLRVRFQDRSADPRTATQLTLAILTALQQVGDGSFNEVVSRLAEGRDRGVDPDIVAAALECLPYLQQQSQNSIASSELVRPSDANSIGGSDTLVRAVTPALSDHPDELLRAVKEGQGGSE